MPGPPTVPKLKLGHVLKPSSKGSSGATSARGLLFESSRSGVQTSRLTSRSQVGSARWQGGQSARSDWREDSARLASSPVEEDGFDPRVFLGTWEDNLSHTITVTECSQRRRGRYAFSAKFQRDGASDKSFTISWVRGNGGDWTCGNGRLVRSECSDNELVWRSEDGRESDWVRLSMGDVLEDSQPIITDSHDDWPTLGGTSVKAPASYRAPRAPIVSRSPSDPAVKASVGSTLSAAAPEFTPLGSSLAKAQAVQNTKAAYITPRAPGVGSTPRPPPLESFDIATPCGTPAVRPMPSPLPGPRSPGPRSPCPLSCPSLEIEMLQDSPDVCVLPGGRLEWVLPDVWKNLGTLPQNFCISSPLFGVERAPSLQLVFYPCGGRTAEQGQCTVALLRGPDCAGLKFELTLNGRGTGPKACVSQRYLGDFPQPCDAVDSSSQKVIIGFRALDTFDTKA